VSIADVSSLGSHNISSRGRRSQLISRRRKKPEKKERAQTGRYKLSTYGDVSESKEFHVVAGASSMHAGAEAAVDVVAADGTAVLSMSGRISSGAIRSIGPCSTTS
jgi:hypothetical protein